VIDVLFEVVERPSPRLYPGQLVDVFIKLKTDDGDPAAEGNE